ncbi:MAG: hypothetical protein IJD59_06180, partial [Clostridia bacterium]|nr:hypothetical protein [Clostridia bacterium]
TPAGKLLALQAVCSPIAVKTVSKRYKRRGSICAISYAIKINAVALHFHRAAAFIIRNFSKSTFPFCIVSI